MDKNANHISPMNSYLDAVYQGKNDWWRYLSALGLILFFWLIIGSIPVFLLGIYVIWDTNPETGITVTGFFGVDPLLAFIVTISGFVFFFLALFLAVRFIHRRPFRSLVTPGRRIDWKRMALGFLFWFVIVCLVSLFEVILYPDRYAVSFNYEHFIVFFIFAILLIPIQAACEELFFRGYLMQSIGLRLRGILVLPLISGVIFGALHFWNPEMTVTNGSWLLGFSYLLIGFFAALITLLDGGLELALGLHIANNLYTSLVANYTVSALPSESIFQINTIDPFFGLVSLIIGLGIFYLLAFMIFPNEKTTQSSGTDDLEVETGK